MENKKINFEGVDEDAIITVNMPGYMFFRLNQLLLSGIGITSNEELLEIAAKVKAGKTNVENTKEYHAETIMYLNAMISEEAKKQKKVKSYTVQAPNTDSNLEIPQPQSPSE